ncbi:MAG: hypothetical protein KDB79_02470, partial [Acidobacteria bacterium]|nr:hypothetical protein [Acidobacteriota bacterium]
MKVFMQIARFSLLCIVISISFGCGYSAKTDDVNAGTNVNNAGDKAAEEKDDGYPTPPEKIASTEFKLLDGETFSIEKSRGKVVLINLWATWCGP